MIPFISPSIDIVMISAVLVIVSKVMQSKFMNKAQMKQDRETMKTQQNRVKELMGKDDEKSKQEIEQINKEMMETMQKSMQTSMRYMMISLPVFLIAFYLLGMFYTQFEPFALPVALPWFAEQGFFAFTFYSETSWFGWYFVSYLTMNILVGIGLKIFEKAKGVQNG